MDVDLSNTVSPSQDDRARGKEILNKVWCLWFDGETSIPQQRMLKEHAALPKHLVLETEPKQHVFVYYLLHPFKTLLWKHVVTLPADKFQSSLDWCALTIEHDLRRQWRMLLERESLRQWNRLKSIEKELAGYE